MEDERWRALLEIFRDAVPAVHAARRWVETQGYGGALGAACTQRHARGVLQSLSRFVPELLAKPVVVIQEEGDAVSVCNRLWIQTLPSAMQADILSFLAAERRHFLSKDLVALASALLAAPETDFWVRLAASKLLNYQNDESSPFFGYTPTLSQKEALDEHNSLPDWLEEYRESVLLSQIPPSQQQDGRTDEVQAPGLVKKATTDTSVHVGDDQDELPTPQTLLGKRKYDVEPEINTPPQEQVQHTTPEEESTAKEILGDELFSRAKNLGVALQERSSHLGLPPDIELISTAANLPLLLKVVKPWLADDETTSLLLGALLGEHAGYAQSTQILTSILLPKLSSLDAPPSRTLLSSVLQAGNAHPRAAADALIIPLLKDGSPVKCDLVNRVVKECFSPEAASALCNRMVCEEQLVWTEGTVGVVHTLLCQKVALEDAAVEGLVGLLEGCCSQFAGSLKFGNLLLSLVGKYGGQVRGYKGALLQVASSTKTFLTKSILAKVNGL